MHLFKIWDGLVYTHTSYLSIANTEETFKRGVKLHICNPNISIRNWSKINNGTLSFKSTALFKVFASAWQGLTCSLDILPCQTLILIGNFWGFWGCGLLNPLKRISFWCKFLTMLCLHLLRMVTKGQQWGFFSPWSTAEASSRDLRMVTSPSFTKQICSP